MEIWRWPSSRRCSEARSDSHMVRSVKLTGSRKAAELRDRPTASICAARENFESAALNFPIKNFQSDLTGADNLKHACRRCNQGI